MKQSLIYQLIVEKSTATSKQLILAIPSKFHTKSSCFKLDWLNKIVLNEKSNLDLKKTAQSCFKSPFTTYTYIELDQFGV